MNLHVYEDFNKDKEVFDFSNYSAKSKYYYDLNKLVVGKMKDETGGVAIKEFVRLKPKMYSQMMVESIKKQRVWTKMLLLQ